ncbi:gamma-glutamyltransferase [Niveispirillum sp. KHB5.9]|uniref:gamma-glutamyltransferase n=1 Tax=Niveispirillum sp. KHB5.9 TaxID=3400269 RepID=UPI003A84F3FB
MTRLRCLALSLCLATALTTLPATGAWAQKESAVITALPVGKAMVSSADPRATEAGREILRQGGSAADAAAALMLALTVVEPESSGIGGGGFMLYHPAGTKDTFSYDGREEAPAAAKPDRFMKNGQEMDYEDARSGGLSVGVPGNIRLIELAHARHGKLPWRALFQPAIKLARDGYVVTPRMVKYLKEQTPLLKVSKEAQELYYLPDGTPKPAGSVIKNPKLADLLTLVAEQGADAFYKGPAADRLRAAVANSPRHASVITADDMIAYRAVPRPPVCGTYRVYTVCGMGPPSSGGIAVLSILKQMEGFDIPAMGKDSVEAWHILGESMRLAYADRAKWLGDPDHVKVPVDGLTDPAYIKERGKLIDPKKAMPKALPGTPKDAPRVSDILDNEIPGTTHFSVADEWGNVASMTSTIEDIYGSGIIVDGYVLNNELTDFNFVPDIDGVPTANRVEPGKRPRSSMSPSIVYDQNGQVVLAIGAAGGPTIIAQVAKAIVGVLDWKLDVQTAIALPTFMGNGDVLRIEAGTPVGAMADKLRAMGHEVQVDDFGGKLNGIDKVTGQWRGGADPRSNGTAGAP